MPTPKKSKPPAQPKRRKAKPETADTLVARAMGLIKRRKHAEAAEQFLAAGKLEPANWRLPNDAGECYFLAGRYVEALRCYSAAMMMMPDMATVLFNRGMAQAMVGEDEAAFVTLQHVLELDQEHAGAYLELGKLHAAAGRHWDAVDAFDRALRQPSADARLIAIALREKARLLLGSLQYEAEGLEVVRALWERTRNPATILALAQDLIDSRKPRAIRVIDIVLADTPRDPKAHKLRAKFSKKS